MNTKHAEIERKALTAAFDVLEPNHNKDAASVVLLGVVLQAAEAVAAIANSEESVAMRNSSDPFYIDTMQVVASAIWAVTVGIPRDDLDDVRVGCVGSGLIVAFAQTAMLLKATADYEIAKEDLDFWGDSLDSIRMASAQLPKHT